MLDTASAGLYEQIRVCRFSQPEIASRNREIYDTMLAESDWLERGNFEQIHPNDLERLFDLYDLLFFDGECGEAARAEGKKLTFRLSSRMTRVGGTTTRQVHRKKRNGPPVLISHEIAVSTTLLFQTFHDVDRPITVTGILCQDRLEALQRVFEHEMIHLMEMLVWTTSSCAGQRFASLATNLFGHTQMTHQLITPRERAETKYGVRVGSRVRFSFEGQIYEGKVNRITKRATVLVEDECGDPYSDGKNYLKFYIPVSMLELVE